MHRFRFEKVVLPHDIGVIASRFGDDDVRFALTSPEMLSLVKPLEMRIEREEGRIYISYDARGDDREIVRVEEVWTFDP